MAKVMEAEVFVLGIRNIRAGGVRVLLRNKLVPRPAAQGRIACPAWGTRASAQFSVIC